MRHSKKAELTLPILIVVTGVVCQKAPAPAQPVATPASQATASSAVAAVASASDFYVATNGSGTACTLTAPCSLATGIGAGSPAHPGDRIYLKAGNYLGLFHADVSGTSGNPITITSAPGQWASIDGGINAGQNGTTLAINGTDLVIRDLEIKNSDPTRVNANSDSNPPNTRNRGINIYGARTKIINCVIHDTGEGIGQWSNAPDSESYGNLVYWVGWTAPDGGHGHTIYIQSTAPGTQKIRENVMFESFGIGYHAYGSSAARLDNIYAEGNVVFASGNPMGGGYTYNYIQGGGVQAVNGSWVSNFSYSPLNYGYQVFGYSSGCSGTSTITGNYFFGRDMAITAPCTPTTMTGNTFVNNLQGFTQAQYPSNTYFPYPTVPTSTQVFVRPNAYEAGRANIIVYNWQHTANVTVDLSAVLSVGSQYEIRYARNYFGTPVLAGTYAGGTVSLPMTGYSAAAPVGFPAPVTTLPEFGVFIVRKVGSQSPTPSQTPLPPTPTTTPTPVPPTPTPTVVPLIGIATPKGGRSPATILSEAPLLESSTAPTSPRPATPSTGP